MRLFIISDDSGQGETIRLLAVKEGFECSSSNILALQGSVQTVNSERPELVVAVLSPNLEHAMAVISTMKGQIAVPIIAVGAATDPKTVLRVLRSGCEDYVDASDLDYEFREALVRFRAKMARSQPVGKIISMISPGGGSGTSTLLANLGVKLSQEFNQVMLVDLHLHTDDLASLLDLSPTFSISDLCQNVASLDKTLFAKTLTPHSSGVQLLAPPRRIAEVAAVSPAGVCQALMMGRVTFPFTLVDLNLQAETQVREVFLQSDMIVMVIRPDVVSLRNARRVIEHLETLGVTSQSIRVVVTMVGQAGEVQIPKIEEALRLKVYHSLPSDPKPVNDCNNVGIPVVTEWPRSRYSASIVELASKIKETLGIVPETANQGAGLPTDPASKFVSGSFKAVQATASASSGSTWSRLLPRVS